MVRKCLLVVGCGDVARRALPQWLERYDVAALARSQKGGAMLPRRVVHISTGGLYGDCGGAARLTLSTVT